MVARSVPVYDLAVARDLDWLTDVVEIILSWHGQRANAELHNRPWR
jgi:hypothetical protein